MKGLMEDMDRLWFTIHICGDKNYYVISGLIYQSWGNDTILIVTGCDTELEEC